ncbi:P-loop containing nucleoside triphosphate hydrolase protein [Guyanagaster necrorhizus]|uniref:P-loop containing nucleoside triphosphate hydrolase protein n=1 Tax=Guyanagaster necrorhizus TaxID=856835 RepID=A0A9P7VWU5_9AGAR|nr:P-loop containing nucleoside triphosphate hydrolase protein [Guyanagaster necrorhizus MCA 3950]KAG7448073.1 P-loop containing nucleoside triphosphate hydrolase protein [Guyanagaster necrorhizus MCA 3950]
MVSATSFVPNGLLSFSNVANILPDENEAPVAGPSSPRTPAPTTFGPPVEASLPATKSSAERALQELVDDIDVLKDMESFLDVGGTNASTSLPLEPPMFKSNGLLSSINSKNSLSDPFIWTGLLSDSLSSQDDDLPQVSEAFSIPHAVSKSTASFPSFDQSTSKFNLKARTFDGRTIFIRRKHKPSPDTRKTASLSTRGMGNLLDVPIHRLLDDISREQAMELSQRQRPSHTKHDVGHILWVDRYRPQRFTDLMGNERVAREILSWVKQWDWCVFGKSKERKRPRNGDENVDFEDEYHRPKEKILLLSGPPGLGKTTMTHVIARQAGYEVVEINASDARSGQIVDDRIRPTLESGSTVGSSKPVLVVIDEIDGATGAGENTSNFIYKLIQLTFDKPRRKVRAGQQWDPNAKRPILRPIICICNDINASSLAKLRLHAYQIRLQKPADVHTVKRLRQVCELEGLQTDTRALSALVGIARGDLRGCINTLQFIKARREVVTEDVIRKATVGMKEAEMSVISVLTDLFSPLSKRRVKELGMGDEEESRYVGRLSRVVDSCGRDSSIAIGCFSHYANLRQHDADFSRYQKANEWLMTFDRFSAAMYAEGEFALSQYLPYTLVPFYPLFQERGGPRVERDQSDWENMQTVKANEEIYKSLGRGLQTASTRLGGDFRHLVHTPIMQLEFAPLINRIISPPLRPVNSQVIKPEERALLSRLVQIMTRLELRFVQERAEDGQLTYRLDPPIDVFVTYDGKRTADIAVSRYAVRHLVAQEVDAELTALQTDIIEKGKKGKHANMSDKTSKARTDDQSSEPSSARPTKRARTEEVDIADRPPTDFFGRPITSFAGAVGSTDNKVVEKKYRVAYKFIEGNSAAVRKPIKVEAFL